MGWGGGGAGRYNFQSQQQLKLIEELRSHSPFPLRVSEGATISATRRMTCISYVGRPINHLTDAMPCFHLFRAKCLEPGSFSGDAHLFDSPLPLTIRDLAAALAERVAPWLSIHIDSIRTSSGTIIAIQQRGLYLLPTK